MTDLPPKRLIMLLIATSFVLLVPLTKHKSRLLSPRYPLLFPRLLCWRLFYYS